MFYWGIRKRRRQSLPPYTEISYYVYTSIHIRVYIYIWLSVCFRNRKRNPLRHFLQKSSPIERRKWPPSLRYACIQRYRTLNTPIDLLDHNILILHALLKTYTNIMHGHVCIIACFFYHYFFPLILFLFLVLGVGGKAKPCVTSPGISSRPYKRHTISPCCIITTKRRASPLKEEGLGASQIASLYRCRFFILVCIVATKATALRTTAGFFVCIVYNQNGHMETYVSENAHNESGLIKKNKI